MLRGQDVNVRSMMLQLGAQPHLIDMAIPMTWFLVGTTDPDEPATIEIIKTLQKGLGMPITGVLDARTARAIEKVSGSGWKHKTWIQIIGDVLNAKTNPRTTMTQRNLMHVAKQAPSLQGLGSYFDYQGPAPGPLPGYMVGLPPGPLGLGDSSTDGGVSLNFGKGTKNPDNMVPVDATTKAAFKDLQRQINRLLSKVGERIGEDGVIGKGTLAGAKTAQKQLPWPASWAVGIATASTIGLASKAVTVADAFRARANQLGIPVNAVTTKKSPPPAVTDVPVEVLPPTGTLVVVGGAVKESLPWILLAGAVAGGAVWWNRRQKKGRR